MAGQLSAKLDLPTYSDGVTPTRSDLHFHGIDHSWSSFEARVFINNPGADQETAPSAESGYVGSFYVFGHGGCFGDEGHCDVPDKPASPFDRRAAHQLTPTSKLVIVTDAVKPLLEDPKVNTIDVTVVPVVRASVIAAPEHSEQVLVVESVSLLTYE
jgi:hypothetical protein